MNYQLLLNCNNAQGKDSETYVVKIKKYDTGTLKKIPEIEIAFERANEESCMHWKLRDGYEFSPNNVGGTRFRSMF
jgi:hypothetical protein